jgi:hypothetical protein
MTGQTADEKCEDWQRSGTRFLFVTDSFQPIIYNINTRVRLLLNKPLANLTSYQRAAYYASTILLVSIA